MRFMRWIGLTGSIGAGKSTVARLLRKSGYAVIDADALAHETLLPGTEVFEKIKAKVGAEILSPTGEIDRRALGQKVFADASLKAWLEQLVHPLVQEKVRSLRTQLEMSGTLIAFYEVPLLFEKNLENQFDKVVVVWVSPEVQAERLFRRNSWSKEEIANRNQAQLKTEEKIKRADFTINNDGSLAELEIQVQDLIKKLNI